MPYSSLLTLLFSLFILSPSSHTSGTQWYVKMVREICDLNGEDWDKTFCIDMLTKDNRVVSATNLVSLATRIIQSGLSNATNTRAYLKDTLSRGNLESTHRKALNECVGFYEGAVTSLNSALFEITDDKDYMTPSYDVLIANDDVTYCESSLAENKVEETSVSAGNKFVRYYAVAANEVLNRLYNESPPPSQKT